MDSRELKTRCLGLPGASEEFPFGDEVSVFKVGGKMFALCSLDAGPPLQLSVKCDPELAAQLRSAAEGAQALTGVRGQGACQGLRAPSPVSTRRMSSAAG